MPTIVSAFLRGLVTLLPVGLTVYLFWILGVSAERLLGGALQDLLPEAFYFPGLGLLVALFLVTLLGLLVRLPGANLLPRFSDALFSAIPVVKSVYTTLRDLTEFVSDRDKTSSGARPVLVTMAGDMVMVGLVTNHESSLSGADQRVLVYLPMSYQLGGYMLEVAAEKLTPLDMTVEEAMQLVLTAGVRSVPRRS
ncbi:MAG: DUF502 domain-containing protein [Pseudomonadota bacterium]